MTEGTPAPAAPAPPPSAADPTGNAQATAAANAAGDAARASALASIAALKGDKAFVAKWAEGDTAARTQLADLQKAAFGDDVQPGHTSTTPEPKAPADGDKPEAGEASAEPPINFDWANKELKAAELIDLSKATTEGVRALGVDPTFAKGAVEQLDRAVSARKNTPMNPVELNRLDFILSERWGGAFAENRALVQKALDTLGPVHGVRLQQAMLAAGPDAAAMAMASLANHMRSCA